MTFIPGKPWREFKITQHGSVADPAWQLAVIETIGDIPVAQQYSNYQVIEDLIEELKYKRAFNDGVEEGRREVLAALGVTFEEYIGVKIK
jgi:hypothetical protein